MMETIIDDVGDDGERDDVEHSDGVQDDEQDVDGDGKDDDKHKNGDNFQQTTK